MKDKFKQFATEYGLIFVGYSGHDRSVMDTLNLLLKSESNFPHGVYWCVRKNEELSRNVDLLSRFPKFKLVEIEGFDEFFADAHASLDLNLQPELSDPYTSLAKKLNNLIENTKIPEPVPGKISQIQKDIDSIGRKISLQTGSVKTIDPDTVDSIGIDAGDVQLKMPVPFELLSQLAKRSGDYHKALDYLLREIESRPSAFVFDEAIKLLSDDKVGSYRSEDVMAKLRKAKDVLVEHPNIAFNMAISLINAKMYDFADEVLDLGIEASKRPGAPKDFNMDFYTLNRLQIKAHKSLSFELEEKSQLVEIKEHGEELSRIGALILLGDFSDAERELKVLFEQGKSPDSIGDWPIMRLLKDHVTDEDVVALLSSDSRTRPKHHVHALSAIENVSDNHNI